MSHDPLYDQMRQQAVNLHNSLRDAIGGSHPELSALQHEVRELSEDFEQRKHPRTIEGRIKVIQNQLKQAQYMSNGAINYNEFDYFHDNYDRMKQGLRRFPNY